MVENRLTTANIFEAVKQRFAFNKISVINQIDEDILKEINIPQPEPAKPASPTHTLPYSNPMCIDVWGEPGIFKFSRFLLMVKLQKSYYLRRLRNINRTIKERLAKIQNLNT